MGGGIRHRRRRQRGGALVPRLGAADAGGAARASAPAMAPLPERRPQRTVAQQMAGDPVSEYARRPPQGLDQHGRAAPVSSAPQGDDHLDIPAFLRRQAN